jgi:nucleoside-diphosphate-sugar epimerase
VIFATGMSGTIGQHLDGCIPLTLDLNSSNFKLEEYIEHHAEIVIHLAGIVGVEKVDKDLELAKRVNIFGTAELARQVRDYSDSKFVYVSSSHVYAKSNTTINEDYLTKPETNYAKMKLESEQTVRSIFQNCEERLLITRIFSILGWSSNPSSLGGSIQRSLRGEISKPIRNGNDQRDFISPKQAASLLVRLGRTKSATGIVNLCSGVPTLVKDAVATFAASAGKSSPSVILENSTTPYLVGDNSRMLNLLQLKKFEWNLDDES